MRIEKFSKKRIYGYSLSGYTFSFTKKTGTFKILSYIFEKPFARSFFFRKNWIMPVPRRNILALLVLLTCMFPPAQTAGETPVEKEVPLWEAGMGLAPLTMPSYRGSRNQQWYPVPMPYVDYRGDFLRIDREGIRGLLYGSDRLRFDLSADGTIPGDTDEDGPRRGMPDLDPAGEIGPSVNIVLHEDLNARIRLRMPVRIVFATDLSSSLRHIGWKVHPHLGVDFRDAFFGWNFGANIGPLFADRKYHGYYYDVKERYKEDFRDSYRAGGGYSGTMLLLTSSRRFEKIWAGVFLRYDNLSGAAFIDSPLVETRHAFMAGLGIAYIFKTSTKTVPVTREDFY